jgi:ABC-type uncharacterized transport system substrate-binding protein
MNKNILSVGLCVLLFLLCISAEAQQPVKVRRIGYLTTGSASSGYAVEAFVDGLRQLGYVEGQNISIDYRYADGRNERLPELAADLVRLKVEVIVASGTQAITAAKNATATIPIIMATSSDPLGKGLAENLPRPGGNVTGSSTMAVELTGKRLEVFREAFPNIRRLAVLWYARGNIDFEEIRKAAQPFGFNSVSVEVARPEDFDKAFALASRERLDCLFTSNAAFMSAHRKRIIDFAAKSKLPAIYHNEIFVEDGGLISYGLNYSDLFRRAAIYVDKILKGAKPADLPVEQPTKFELWINLKTAKQIGVTIPPSVLYRADKVIR